MLKQQAKLLRNIAVSIDAMLIVTAFLSAGYFTRGGTLDGIYSFLRNYIWIFMVVLPVWYFLFANYGLYSSLRTCTYAKIFSSVLKVHVIGAMVTASSIYLVEPHGLSRTFFYYFIICSLFLTYLEKAIIKLLLGFIRRRGYNFRNILIAGTNAKAELFTHSLEEHPYWGLKITGFVRYFDEMPVDYFSGYRVLGQIEDIKEVCKSHAVDEVVFCLPKENMAEVDDMLNDMEEMGITVRMVLDYYVSRSHRKELDYFHNKMPILTIHNKPFDTGQLFLKRCLDIAGALIGLSFTALLFPFIALALRLETPGPLFFGQLRVGENGRLFRCWKFRSMYLDAEERKAELLHLNEMQGAIFKIKDDPRITKVGNFLRKTSLDELPQFWNVLRGEMSLVGTRPPTPEEVADYEHWHHKRICIKPGITGMWQVNGRNEIKDFDEVVRLDVEYIDKWTLWLDIKLLFKTIWVVATRNGSY